MMVFTLFKVQILVWNVMQVVKHVKILQLKSVIPVDQTYTLTNMKIINAFLVILTMDIIYQVQNASNVILLAKNVQVQTAKIVQFVKQIYISQIKIFVNHVILIKDIILMEQSARNVIQIVVYVQMEVKQIALNVHILTLILTQPMHVKNVIVIVRPAQVNIQMNA